METEKKVISTTKKEEQKPPTYLCIPIKEEKSNSSNQNKELKNLKRIETKEKVKKKKKGKKNVDEEEDLCSFMNPEMRGGVLYTKCDCLIRNGLQDDCPLTLCQGQPDCLIKPWPLCPPGKYYRNRHPEIYPSPGN
ncbi:uncharacterized protein LOC122507129 [Leptopilina heterotoma]|uniref:uncharacterized protein LOC122507129 n=1 Tax=Leptopilina heterotoma TaxID=63436 RepID=UPI001CA95A5D|nr:uncharacterized protein LOC122507129 [Leptopilina heterotoma]